MGASVTVIENAVSKGLHEIGVMVEDSRFIGRRIFAMLHDDLKADPGHPFYDFARSARILARQEGIHVNDASKMIMRHPELLFEIHDLKPGEAPPQIAVQQQQKTKPVRIPAMRLPQSASPPPLPEESLPEIKFRKGFNLKDLALSLRETVEKTGKRPSLNDGPIIYGPLAGKFSWSAVNQKLAYFSKRNEAFRHASLISFSDFILGPKPVKSAAIAKAPAPKGPKFRKGFNIEDLKSSIQISFDATGRRPRLNDGMITHGPLANKFTWASVNQKLMAAKKAHPDFSYATLKEMTLTVLGPEEKTVSLKSATAKPERLPFTATSIFNLVAAEIAKTGEVPRTAELEKLGSFSLDKINKAFARASLPGLEVYTLPGQTTPKSLQEFMLVAGLAKLEDRKLVPALPARSIQPS